MNLQHRLTSLLATALLLAGCSDDSSGETQSEGSETVSSESDSSSESSASSGDGDGDGDTTTGDGDGDPTTGDGDGDTTTGDGDGDTTTGDGDGDTTTGDGDGDGDTTTGDGDGDTTTGDGDGDGDEPPPGCESQQAEGMGPCDQFFGYAWNGLSCEGVSGCDCIGDDCDDLFQEPDACEAAYADCEPAPPGACPELNEVQCQQAPNCEPLNGAQLVELPNDALCIEAPAFVVCAEPLICGDALTWGCGPDEVPHLFSSTCIPEGWNQCQPPIDNPNECP